MPSQRSTPGGSIIETPNGPKHLRLGHGPVFVQLSSLVCEVVQSVDIRTCEWNLRLDLSEPGQQLVVVTQDGQ